MCNNEKDEDELKTKFKGIAKKYADRISDFSVTHIPEGYIEEAILEALALLKGDKDGSSSN